MNVSIDKNDKRVIPLPKNNARKCAKRIIEILWEKDNFDKIKEYITDGINLGIEGQAIKTGSLANVFCTDKSKIYEDKTRTFQDTVYTIEKGSQIYIAKLTTQWQGFKTEQDNYQKNRTYLWALRDLVNICYTDTFLIENDGEEAWITFLDDSATSSVETKVSFKKCYEELTSDDANYYSRYIKALIQKPFVILTGNSGTGKTKIASDLAKKLEVSFSDGTINSLVIQVGADWTDTSKILGFWNPLNKEYKKTNILEFIESANRHSNIPFFLILDEMNLSHVERYFSDFLSLMETPELSFELDNYDSVSFPKNLFVTGTVNIDETTYMFSPKVLDRANVIEFKPSKECILSLLIDESSNEKIIPANDGSAEAFMKLCEKIRKSKVNEYEDIEFVVVKAILDILYDILEKAGFEFAYRTVKEISRYLIASFELEGGINFNLKRALDEQIVQKVLPKIHGNKKQIGNMLLKLNEELSKHSEFKLSQTKVQSMIEKLDKFQYTSFI